MTLQDFHAIIPAGGAGTRLWPLSRRANPKFLLDLDGRGRTLLQQTWDRIEPLTGADQITVVTGVAHADAVNAQLPELRRLVREPAPRDSMPAIGLAAALIASDNPSAIIGSFAADHLISDSAAFAATVEQAVAVARTGKVCTIGISATEPSTGFGYIQSGMPLEIMGAPDARHVERFVEKPDRATAAEYLRSGSFMWNAGMFVVSAQVLLDHLAQTRPELREQLGRLAELGGATADPELWESISAIAIDHALAEPVAATGGVAIVPATFDWFDVGDFRALSQIARSAATEVMLHDSSGLVIGQTGRPITVLGMADVVVIDTPDGLLVTSLEHAQRVKELPAAWKVRGREDLM